jgi:methionyl-tRNA formyltransferase
MSPIPGAWTEWDGKKVKFLKCEVFDNKSGISGHFSMENDNFLLQTSSGSVKVLLIQPAGKKVMKIEDFLAGYRGNKEGKVE